MDPGHTTTSLSANQTIQLIRAVGRDVTQVSCGLSEDVLVRSREVSGVGLLGLPGRSLFPKAFVSTVVESVASQSLYSLPTVTGVSNTSKNCAGIELRQMAVIEPRVSQMVRFAEISDPEESQGSVLAQLEELRKVKRRKEFCSFLQLIS